jgi:hypothetical protein
MSFLGGKVVVIEQLGAKTLIPGRRGFPNVEYGSHPNRPLNSTVGHLKISIQDGVHTKTTKVPVHQSILETTRDGSISAPVASQPEVCEMGITLPEIPDGHA